MRRLIFGRIRLEMMNMNDGSNMKIAVFGMGGVGGLIGGVLARVHDETYFVARGENLNAIRRGGMRVSSVRLGDFTARPKGRLGQARGTRNDGRRHRGLQGLSP